MKKLLSLIGILSLLFIIASEGIAQIPPPGTRTLANQPTTKPATSQNQSGRENGTGNTW